jgi:hypothetical protein
MNAPHDTGGPAFPVPALPGMTLRDRFAIAALPFAHHAWAYSPEPDVEGPIENAVITERPVPSFTLLDREDRDRVAELSYLMADALLRARSKDLTDD